MSMGSRTRMTKMKTIKVKYTFTVEKEVRVPNNATEDNIQAEIEYQGDQLGFALDFPRIEWQILDQED